MAYAIRVVNGLTGKYSGRKFDGWISAYGYTTALNIDSARRFGRYESAEEFAFMLTVKVPVYIGKLEVVCIVLGPKRYDGWRIHTKQRKKENRNGTVLRRNSGQPRHGNPHGR